jgi:calcineurin-like phosphoesterase family protein
MAAIWYTSDLHFGHEKVAGLRGFNDTDYHDEHVTDKWRSKIKPQDTVYVLGDLTCDQRKEEYALDLIASLPGTKHLIAGNHDAVSSIHRNGWKRVTRYLEVFASVRDFAKVRMRRQDVLLSHYPYNGDHTERERYNEYRLRDEGLPLIHGHTHKADQRLHYGALQTEWLPENGPGEGETLRVSHTPQVHVGLDAWGLSPVASHVVEKLLFESEED